MTTLPDLTSLLPAIYGIRDAQNDHPLRALLGVIEEQAKVLERDIEDLYDNWFIETCDEWVVPYIGDLLGARGLFEIGGDAISRRAFVANALAYRRGKGTAVTLEQVARDVTGWRARAVEFFSSLAWNQNVNHVRAEAAGNAALENANALQLISGPFETVPRTGDVRNVDAGRGRYNVPNVGLFLWRSRAYPMERSPARLAGPGRYRIHQHGGDAPLFNAPVTETRITHLSTEINVPGPIRRRALHDDLAAFHARVATVGTNVPGDSDYYGPSRSIEVIRDGRAVSPLDVIAADLSAWDPPPPATVALRSGDLSSYVPPAAASPEIEVTIGDETRVVTLDSAPATLDDAADAIARAVRAASPGAAFAGARVILVADRLVVLPGVRDFGVAIGPTGSDATTASDLRLAAPDGEAVLALVSAPLDPFPPLPASPPLIQVGVSIAGDEPVTAPLAATPATVVDAAAQLESAIRSADTGAAFTDAVVAAAGDRLVVIAGTGEPIVLYPTADDPTTARLLRLGSVIAIDPELGRLTFALGDEPDGDVLVSYNYGFPGDLGGGPYDRRTGLARATPDAWSRTVSRHDAAADFASLADALAAWLDPADGAGADAVVTIADNDAYAEQLSIAMPAARTLVVQAAFGRRPRVRCTGADDELEELTVTGGDVDAALVLDGLFVEGSIRVEAGALGSLRLRHCTLVPGRAFGPRGTPNEVAVPSLVVVAPNDRLDVQIEQCVTGPIETPPNMRGLDIATSIVEAPEASSLPVLISGSLGSFPALSSVTPQLSVTIGHEGPHVCRLEGVPTTLSEARDMLDAALRTSSRSSSFTDASVVSVAGRLVIVPGLPRPVRATAVNGDPSASELRLTSAQSTLSLAVLTRPLDPFPALTSSAPKLGVTMGDNGPHAAVFPSAPASIAQARDALQDAIRAANGSQAFSSCLVARAGRRLIVIPGAPHTRVRFTATDDDATTVAELGLHSGGVALSGPEDRFGAPIRIATSTVIGRVATRSANLLSESIFTELVIAERRQVGCARFSFLARGSVVPRRFRCQPADGAEDGRVMPSFTSSRYGDPAYAQLAPSCPREIAAGADDEGEMGAWHFLQQQARLANLRVGLDEYLRFGLDAGVFFVT